MSRFILFAFLVLTGEVSGQDSGDTSNHIIGERFKINAEFPGGEDALYTYIQENIVFPEDAPDSIDYMRVYTRFTIDTIGKVINESVENQVPEYFASESLCLLDNMPLWDPGKQPGQQIECEFILPIHFIKDTVNVDTTAVYEFPEQLASFPGGEKKMYEYLRDNLKFNGHYTESCSKLNLRFVVWIDGSIRNIEVVGYPCAQLESQIVPVIQKMPAWNPAMHKGKIVPGYFMLPIRVHMSY